MKHLFGVIVALLLVLTGCDERKVVKSERVTMEVVGVSLKSKTNSKVDLKIVGTSLVYRDMRLSCSRNRAENVRIGSKWDVVVEDWKQGDRYGTSVVGTSGICDKSQP